MLLMNTVKSRKKNIYVKCITMYGVYISQLLHYSRAGVQYSDFLDRTQTLAQKLIKQGYVAPRLKSPLQ
jgi:hypothetical protein